MMSTRFKATNNHVLQMLHLSTYPSIVSYLSTANGVVDTDDDDDDGSEKLIIVSHQSNRIICISKMKKLTIRQKRFSYFILFFTFPRRRRPFGVKIKKKVP